MTSRAFILRQDEATGSWFGNVICNKDKWEAGPYKTPQEGLESCVHREKIMNSVRKPKGDIETRIKVGDSRWIAVETTEAFKDVQKELMFQETQSPYMFLSDDQISKPYPSLMQFHWNESFRSESHETSEELAGMNSKTGKCLFNGVFYRDEGWIFEIKCSPYFFTSNSYNSMFIAWIERELCLIHLGLERLTDLRRSDDEGRENMEKLYASLSIPKFDEEAGEYFAQLYSRGDSRVKLIS